MQYRSIDEIMADDRVPTALKTRLNVARQQLKKAPPSAFKSYNEDSKPSETATPVTINEDGKYKTEWVDKEKGEYVAEVLVPNSDGTTTIQRMIVNTSPTKGYVRDVDGNEVEAEVFNPPCYEQDMEIKRKQNEFFRQFFESNPDITEKFKEFVNRASNDSATEEDIHTVFGDSDSLAETDEEAGKPISRFQRCKNAFKKLYKSPEFKARKDEAYESESTNRQAESDIYYTDGAITVGNKAIKIRMAKIEASWEDKYLSKMTKNGEANLLLLIRYITDDVIKFMGGLNRIRSIIVTDDALIINKVCYVPVLASRKDLAKKLPLDVATYIEHGKAAQLFDWSVLIDMPNLAALYVDSEEFYMFNVLGSLGIDANNSVANVFSTLKSLQELGVGQNIVTRSSIPTTGATVNTNIKKRYKIRELTDSFNMDIRGWTRKGTAGSAKALKENFMRGDRKVSSKIGHGLLWTGLLAITGVSALVSHLTGFAWDKYTERKE